MGILIFLKKFLKKENNKINDRVNYADNCGYCGVKMDLFEGKQCYRTRCGDGKNSVGLVTLCKRCEEKMLDKIGEIAQQFTQRKLFGKIRLKGYTNAEYYVFDCYPD